MRRAATKRHFIDFIIHCIAIGALIIGHAARRERENATHLSFSVGSVRKCAFDFWEFRCRQRVRFLAARFFDSAKVRIARVHAYWHSTRTPRDPRATENSLYLSSRRQSGAHINRTDRVNLIDKCRIIYIVRRSVDSKKTAFLCFSWNCGIIKT